MYLLVKVTPSPSLFNEGTELIEEIGTYDTFDSARSSMCLCVVRYCLANEKKITTSFMDYTSCTFTLKSNETFKYEIREF